MKMKMMKMMAVVIMIMMMMIVMMMIMMTMTMMMMNSRVVDILQRFVVTVYDWQSSLWLVQDLISKLGLLFLCVELALIQIACIIFSLYSRRAKYWFEWIL